MLKLLAFELAGRVFGLPSACVREVVRAVWVEALPGAPRAVEGIIGVRGRAVPVFDLRWRFGLPARPVDPSEHVILARASGRDVAFRVDRALWLATVDAGAVAASDEVMAGSGPIAGVASLEEGLIVIHDPDAFLEAAEAEALDAALAARAAER
ncbi:MAG TPA: CheW domain-containing protein [Longimicrobiales bacterium]